MNAGQDLRELAQLAANKLESMANEFMSVRFTDRYGDGPAMLMLAQKLNAALTAAQPDSSTVAQEWSCKHCHDSKVEFSNNGDGPYPCRWCYTPPQDEPLELGEPDPVPAWAQREAARIAQPAPVTDAVLEVIAKHVGRTSNIFRYIRDDLAALSPAAQRVDGMTALTSKQAAVICAFTGIFCGDFSSFHEYVEEVMGRPVYTHEMASKTFSEELKETSRKDFMALIPADHAAQDVQEGTQ